VQAAIAFNGSNIVALFPCSCVEYSVCHNYGCHGQEPMGSVFPLSMPPIEAQLQNRRHVRICHYSIYWYSITYSVLLTLHYLLYWNLYLRIKGPVDDRTKRFPPSYIRLYSLKAVDNGMFVLFRILRNVVNHPITTRMIGKDRRRHFPDIFLAKFSPRFSLYPWNARPCVNTYICISLASLSRP